MYHYIMQSKKLKTYFLLLIILWLGTIGDTIIKKNDFIGTGMSNVFFQKEKPVILLEDEYEGKRYNKEKDELVRKIVSHFQGQIEESIITEELYTVYAYTPLIDNYILTNRKKINLNLLFFYNEERDITTFLIATPIYNQDY